MVLITFRENIFLKISECLRTYHSLGLSAFSIAISYTCVVMLSIVSRTHKRLFIDGVVDLVMRRENYCWSFRKAFERNKLKDLQVKVCCMLLLCFNDFDMPEMFQKSMGLIV